MLQLFRSVHSQYIEYWLVAENTTLAVDGYERHVIVFNGTYPGPTIIADCKCSDSRNVFCILGR